MKLINNRYRIINMLKDSNEETYIVEDLRNKGERQILRIIDNEKNNNIVSYFTDNFVELEQIRHKNLLNSYKFDIIETINLKNASVKLYFTTSEFFEAETLNKVKSNLDFKQKLNIILDLMSVLDFLHFRGIVYKYLSPEHIFYTKDNSIKLLNLSSILEKILNSQFDKQSEYFIAPEVIMNLNNNVKNIRSDYYSMGMIMKYLLCGGNLDDGKCKDFDIKEEEKDVLLNIINDLTHKDVNQRNITLRKHIDNIINTFNLSYKYDLKEERNFIFLKTKVVGRDNEIKEVLKIDSDITNNTNIFHGLKINGYIGSGKTRFLNEIIHRLKMNGRQVHKIDIISNDAIGISNIANFLKQIISSAYNHSLDKYKDDFSKLLPDLSPDQASKHIDFGQINEKYRIFNRVSNFLNDITKEDVVYLVIDGFEKTNDIFISFIDYLMKHSKLNKVFFILAYNEGLFSDVKILDKLKSWEDENLITSLKLNNLSEESTGLLVKSILGISYVPKKFSSVLYKESKGNPGYIDFIINDLFNRGELYIASNGCWETKKDDYSEINFPMNYFDAIKNKLERFEDDYLSVLKIISIFNTILSKEVLQNMTDIEPTTLDKILDELITERIIEQHIAEWGYNYNIFSVELKRYIYWNLSDNEKLKLHKKAADTIFEIYGDRVNNIMDELVYHLVKSNNNDLALKLVFEEAEKIDNKYSLNAIVLWEKAYTIVRDDDIENRLKILYVLTDIFTLKGNDEKLNIYLNELYNLSIESKTLEYEIKARYYRVKTFLRTNKLDDLRIEIDALEKVSRENHMVEGIICSSISKGRMYLYTNNLEPIEEIMKDAIDLSLENGLYKYLGSIYMVLGNLEYLKGNSEGAIRLFTKSKKYFEEDNNVYEAVRPINNLGVIYSDLYGDFETGLSYYMEGLKIASNYGFSQLEALFLNNIAEVYFNSLDFEKSLENILLSRRMAIEINDYRLTFLSYITLGLIDLTINRLDKAYNCYITLKNLHSSNPILDDETLCTYYNFLGEFYFEFGNYKLALEYSKKASDISKDFNIKEHLRAESRILFITYLKNGYIDKNEIDSIIARYQKSGIKYENLRNILHFCKLTLLKGDINLTSLLLAEYQSLSKGIDNEYLNVNCELIDLILKGTKQSFLKIENTLLSLNSHDFLRRDIELRHFLGMWYLEAGDYSKALSILLNTFDILYESVKAIEDFEFKISLINAKSGDKIKENINNIFKLIYKKKVEYIPLTEVNEDNIDNYFDFSEIIDSLSKDEFNELINTNDENLKIRNIDDLLLSLNEDCQHNLDLILRFICKETLAQRGYIIISTENDSYDIISNNDSDDLKLPKEVFLMQSLRNREPLLINRKTKELNKRYMDFLPKGLTALICVPIIIYDYDDINYNRRKHESQNSEVSGYIYLETNSVLNRFDMDRCRLICSLTNLIYLNIENKKLKLLSTTDKLTNIYTRKFFEYKMEHLLNVNKHSGNGFSVLMIDIDKFKNINDNYGHLKGDEVLYYIGKTIKNSIRSTDIVGRYGGEEIIVILQNTSIKNGMEIGEKIRSKIEELKVPGIDLPITVSIGISQYPNHGHFKEELINKADQALYYAKEILSRNSVALWNDGMEKVFNKTNKVYGIITGNTIIDNRNVLAIIETSELIMKNKCYRKRVYEFLGKLINIVEGEYASLSLVKDNELNSTLTRKRQVAHWVKDYHINSNLINRVLNSKKGEYLIDWESVEDIDKATGNPNWQSVIVLPLIKNDMVIAMVYITVPLKEKEFNYNNFNMVSVLGNIFTSNL